MFLIPSLKFQGKMYPSIIGLTVDTILHKMKGQCCLYFSLKSHHCEIAGWGRQEYNNSATYPDSIRAARIHVGNVSQPFCDRLYGRKIRQTGKFCAGGTVDACQVSKGAHSKGVGLYAELSTDIHNFHIFRCCELLAPASL